MKEGILGYLASPSAPPLPFPVKRVEHTQLCESPPRLAGLLPSVWEDLREGSDQLAAQSLSGDRGHQSRCRR